MKNVDLKDLAASLRAAVDAGDLGAIANGVAALERVLEVWPGDSGKLTSLIRRGDDLGPVKTVGNLMNAGSNWLRRHVFDDPDVLFQIEGDDRWYEATALFVMEEADPEGVWTFLNTRTGELPERRKTSWRGRFFPAVRVTHIYGGKIMTNLKTITKSLRAAVDAGDLGALANGVEALRGLKMAPVEFRARLEAMSNADLLGSKQIAKLREGEIASRLEEKEYELNDWCDWDLLGYGSTRKSRSRRNLREYAIERRLEAEEEALGKMTDEELIGKDYLAKLRQETIERRLGNSDDQ